MKTKNELPPIYKEIVNAGMKPSPYTLYTYGDTVYNPSGMDIPDYLEEHESIHIKQQELHGRDKWWSRYLDDQYFRIEQEVEAYAYQYDFMCKKIQDRNRRNLILVDMSRVLSSDTYGNVISGSAARDMIKKKSNTVAK